MHRYYCTYFDKNYLVKALAMIASLNRESGGEFTLFAVCLDELTRTLIKRLNLPNVVTVPLHEIERGDAELLAAKKTRSIVEYYWTLTPSVLLWLLNRHQEIELLTYLDADLYFFGSADPIFEELGDNSILIHGHRFPEMLKHLESFGKYNVGLLCFRRDSAGLEALNWWRARCNEWCFCKIEEGKYGDQLYLDDWPKRFRKVRVLEHIGTGVAPWNHIQYRFRTAASGEVEIDDTTVVFYHFHSLDFVRPDLIIPAKFILYPLREDIVRSCIMPYLKELGSCIAAVRALLPNFSSGLYNDRLLAAEHTVIAAKVHARELAEIGIAHPKLDLDADWECHCSGQMSPPAPPYERSRVELCVKKAPPRISLVIPSYNYGQYLEACLDSILSQGYQNLELMVLDGGSTDRSPAIIEGYRKHLSYSRSRPDAGQYSAIEEGFARGTGELMGWLNADDMFHPGAFQIVSEVFAGRPEVEWLAGRPNSFDEQGKQNVVLSFLPMTSRAKYLPDQELIQQEGIFWRRGLWQRSGGYLDRELTLAADLELWARFLRSARLFCVDGLIAGFRDHPLQKSKDKAAYTAQANLVLERERKIFAGEAHPFSPPAPLPILLPGGVGIS